MPEPGRPAAESGNTYHDVATVHRLVDIIAGAEILDVWPEAIADVDDIVVRHRSGLTEYCQVKESSPSAQWTVAALDREGVLRAFSEQLTREPSCELVFITGGRAQDFREVCERARNARANETDQGGAAAEWASRLGGRKSFVEATEVKLQIDRSAALRLFSAIRVEESQGSLAQRRDFAVERLGNLVQSPKRALLALERLARESARQRLTITLEKILTALREAGVELKVAPAPSQIEGSVYADRLAAEADRLDIVRLPNLEVRVDGGEQTLAPESLPRCTYLVGAQGSGKSRAASLIARLYLSAGRPGLHVRLSLWATDFWSLLAAELSQLLGRPARDSEIDELLSMVTAFVVADGLDEVPEGLRDMAARQIHELAARYPQLQMLITSRPPREHVPTGWSRAEIRELSDAQVSSVLGNDSWRWQWPESVASLVHNPLMLGLVRPLVAESGYLPKSEVELLAAFTESITRIASDHTALDRMAGRNVLEELAYRWLIRGSLALSPATLREMAADVARSLRDSGVATLNAGQVEDYALNVGVGVRLADGTSIPLHRALLDHLAGGALLRRDASAAVGEPTLREAVSHYCGSWTSVGESLIAVLDRVAQSDLELFARCRALGRKDAIWTSPPDEFGTAYIRALRLLESGPLPGLRLAPPTVDIQLDRGLTWISESTSREATDSVTIVDAPARAYMETATGEKIPIQVISTYGHTSREITSHVPHFTAYDRIRDALEHAIDKRLLPIEGPDITYERLVRLRDLMERVLGITDNPPPGFSRGELSSVSARELLQRTEGLLRSLSRGGSTFDIKTSLLLFVPSIGGAVLAGDEPPDEEDPRHPSGHRSGLAVHCGSLVMLEGIAEDYGIADMPLHGLGLRPESTDDRILSLPPNFRLLRGDDLLLYVLRHEQGCLRAYREIVRRSLPGLAEALPTYRSLPWRLRVTVREDPQQFWAGTAYSVIEEQAGVEDHVSVEAGPEPDRNTISRWAALSSLESIQAEVYRMLSTDSRDLLRGSYSLGARSLA